MAGEKVHKVDYDAKDFLLGVAGMKPFDIGVYWVAVSLIIEAGGPIHIKDGRLYTIMKARVDAIDAAMERLTLVPVGREPKLIRRGDLVTNKRADKELNAARSRIDNSRNAAKSRWDREQNGAGSATDNETGTQQNQLDRNAYASMGAVPLPSPSLLPSPSNADLKPNREASGKKGRVRKNAQHDPEGYAAFYAAFPKKVDPDDGAKAFARVVKSGAAAAEQLVQAAKDYAAIRAGEDQKYTKGPARFLNSGGWRTVAAQKSGAETQDAWTEETHWRVARLYYGVPDGKGGFTPRSIAERRWQYGVPPLFRIGCPVPDHVTEQVCRELGLDPDAERRAIP